MLGGSPLTTHQFELTPVHLEVPGPEVPLELAAFEVPGAGHAGPERPDLALQPVQLRREGRPAGQAQQGAGAVPGPGRHRSRAGPLQPAETQVSRARPQHLRSSQVSHTRPQH